MTAAPILSRAGDGAPLNIAFGEIAERAGIAETYARTAADFASVGDRRGASYALRQAAIALASAVDAAATLRPAHRDGGGR
ncbi:hypothetical protein Q8W71_29780 [Methylobacterium sp. NEAU 140]|uniref:hypothetical protein n=1 Tax=Methylobacterium sp. NEAU 140 TaxID=3064945 RepID=UPI002732C9CA|nr:hypothetical protein [Methylobacterium sp. NEAU 140]MDP4026799.1 hypothetical protein [Methylobacterium sp. NEAU 140]